MGHVLVGAVEETELLLAVRRIVCGIDVQQNVAALADLPATKTNELIQADRQAVRDAPGKPFRGLPRDFRYLPD